MGITVSPCLSAAASPAAPDYWNSYVSTKQCLCRVKIRVTKVEVQTVEHRVTVTQDSISCSVESTAPPPGGVVGIAEAELRCRLHPYYG